MAKLDFVMFANSVSIDRDTNALSIFNIVEGLGVPAEIPEPPKGQYFNVGPPISIVVVCRRSNPTKPEEGLGRVRIFPPNQKAPVGGEEFKIDLTGTNRGSRAILKLPFLPYNGPGTYRLVVELRVGREKWKKLGSRELPVIKQD